MIYIDPRVGSKELLPLIHQLHTPACLEPTEFGDCHFGGNTPQGWAKIGIERKTLGDALQCMVNGRFAGYQLPGMVTEYEYPVLMLESNAVADAAGVLCEWRKGSGLTPVKVGYRKFAWQDWANWQTTLCLQYPTLRIIHTRDMLATAKAIVGLYHHLQADWDSHQSAKSVYIPPPPVTLYREPSLARKLAYLLPGVGWERSKVVAERFPTVAALAASTLADWMAPKLPGVGKTTAQRAIDAIKSQD